MSHVDGPENQDLPPSDDRLAASTDLKPRSDMTYRLLRGLSISGADAYQSLFTGSLISSCSFQQVRFSVSDIDGIRAEKTDFANCDFTKCDIRSSNFNRCTFTDCNLDNSFIDDCKFDDCEFLNCTFEGASLTKCRFQDSQLRRCSIKHATFLHHRFYRSKISEMILGNCSLLYLILRDCTLTDVSINAESIGAIFGLSRTQLEASQIVYLGKPQKVPPASDIVTLLYEQYEKRKWYLGLLILSLSYNATAPLVAFRKYLAASKAHFAALGFTKGDEIQFLADVLDELAAHAQLPFLTLLDVLEWCSSLESVFSSKRTDPIYLPDSSISLLASRSVLLTNYMLDKLPEELPWPVRDGSDISLDLEAVFFVEPQIRCAELLNILQAASTLGIRETSSLIRFYTGSYVEIIHTSLYTVFAFRVFLFLLNGCVIQMTELKGRLNVLSRKRLPKTYTELVLGSKQQPFSEMVQELKSLASSTKEFAFLQDDFLGGFDKKNIKSLAVHKENAS